MGRLLGVEIFAHNSHLEPQSSVGKFGNESLLSPVTPGSKLGFVPLRGVAQEKKISPIWSFWRHFQI
jgi:hypothetical protein